MVRRMISTIMDFLLSVIKGGVWLGLHILLAVLEILKLTFLLISCDILKIILLILSCGRMERR